MSITLTRINSAEAIKSAPDLFNQNYDILENTINNQLSLLSITDNKLKLTNFLSIPSNSIEAATIAITGQSGNVISVSPAGAGNILTIDNLGNLTAKSLIANGTGNTDKSVFNTVDVLEILNVNEIVLAGNLNLSGTNTKVIKKLDTIDLTDANFGASAPNPLDIQYNSTILLNYSAVTSTDGLNLDTSNITEGQEFELHCLTTSTSGNQKLYNGTSGDEIFAYINPTGTGITIISNTVSPEFVPTAVDTKSYLKIRWTNIGGGIFKFLVIDSKNVTGVS